MIQPVHVIQLLLAVAAVALVVDRFRALLFRAPLDTKPFLAAVGHALEDGDVDDARSLAAAGRPAWVAEVVEIGLEATGREVMERAAEVRFEATQRLYALRVFASLGTALGFLGAMVELIWLMSGDHGLLALQAGLVERIAMERGILAMVLGVAISVFCLVALSILKKAAIALVQDVARASDLLESHGFGASDIPR